MMKRAFTLWLLSVVAVGACYGGDIVFDATVDYDPQNAVAGHMILEKEGVKIDVSNGLANGYQYRFYKNQTVTVTSSVGDITGIVFTCTASGEAQYGPGNFVVDRGQYDYSGQYGQWSGQEDSIVFITAGSQVRATMIVVTINGDGVSRPVPPVISPAGGTFTGPVQVRMSSPSNGARIYYTLDGSDPDSLSTAYVGPFMVDTDLTVKAVAVRDSMMSLVSSAAFSFVEGQVDGLGQVDSLDDGVMFVSGYDATVLWHARHYLFLRDVTGYALVYGDVGRTYRKGDVIAAGWSAQKATYNGHSELMSPFTGFDAPKEHVNVDPEEFTHLGPDVWGHYVIVHDVVFDPEKRVFRDRNGNEFPYYNTFGITLPEDGRYYDICGIVGSYWTGGGNVIYQLLITEVMGTYIPEHYACCLSELRQPPVGYVLEKCIFFFKCPLIVVYQSGPRLYVKDQCGDYTMFYSNIAGGPFSNGDLIIGSVEVDFLSGSITPVGEWELVGPGPEVEPEEVLIEEIGADMLYAYIRIMDVKIVTDGFTTYLEDRNGCRIAMYNPLNLPIPDVGAAPSRWDVDGDGEVNIADVNRVIDIILSGTKEYVSSWTTSEDGETRYDVDGIVNVYRGMPEVLATAIRLHGAAQRLKGDMNDDGEVTVSDVMALVDHLLER